MKILYFSPTYSPITHGPALTAQIIANLPSNKYSIEIRMVSESFEFDAPPNAYFIDIKINRVFHAWGKWIRMWRYYQKAIEIYKDYPFDYLLFNDALLGFFSALWWQSSTVQIWGFCNDYAYMSLSSNVNKWKLSFLMECLHTIAEFGTMKLADGIFTCSQSLRNMAIHVYGIKSDKIKCLYPGIYLSFWTYKFRCFKSLGEMEEILFVKSDYKNGGLLVLLNALNRLSHLSFRLHIVGTPSSQLTNLQILLNKYPKLNIVIYGQVSPFKVRELMYQCDMLCIPSINEGFGIANIEGLATGISVVSSSAGGIPEVLPMDKYGWTVPPNDDISLAKSIEYCWLNKMERSKRSQAGRAMVELHFTSQHLQENFIQCIMKK